MIQDHEGNIVLEILSCVIDAVRMFIGDIKVESALVIAADVPIFALTYLFGVVLALHVTISKDIMHKVFLLLSL